MDYEKLHKDTIAKLQEMVNSGKITVETARGICADFVPESEDEKIRKAIINIFAMHKDYEVFFGVSVKDILAWLEKQGEQKPVEPQQDMLSQEKYAKAVDECIYGEQKPAWSEEDEKAINDIMWIIEAYKKNGFNETHMQIANDSETWLKCLKDRVQPQPKQEWSEEEIETCAREAEDNNCIILAKHIRQLKSLRPQNTWKPSDEQIKVLDEILIFAANHENPHWNDYIFGTLNSLIRQLIIL